MVVDRTLSAAEVTEHALERIETLNPSLNAFVALDGEEALAQAAAIDKRLEAGEAVGPLAGIPVGVKDLADATGFPTTRGAMHLRDAPPAAADSTEVARLRAAGGVIVGKTNTPEFGCIGDTYNPLFGATWESVESEPLTRRVVWGHGRGGGFGDGTGGHWLRRRWLNPHPLVDVRVVRAQGQPWPCAQRSTAFGAVGLVVCGADGPAGARCGLLPRCRSGPPPVGSA